MAIGDAFSAHKISAQVKIVAALAGLNDLELSCGVLEDEVMVWRSRVEHAEAVGSNGFD